MAFKTHAGRQQGVQLLQKSLEQGRLAHGYLFTGDTLEDLEALAATLAKTLNCLQPVRAPNGTPIDACDACLNCRRIDHGNHPDVYWIRPESKLRVILMDQIRDLIASISLKPSEARHKVAIIVAADRLSIQTANAFLKTLEEPPANSVLILLTTDPQRLIETILSRCLRLNFGGEGFRSADSKDTAWLQVFAQRAASDDKSLISRYCLLDVLLQRLGEIRTETEELLKTRSPLERNPEAEKSLRDRWEEELNAAIEAEYRRRRADLLLLLEWWLRDIWLATLGGSANADAQAPEGQLLRFPNLASTAKIASRISPEVATTNLEVIEQTLRRLATNVQEALALEVGLLKLRL
jgi:DNA polymerase-3 subunit delta'